jgi:hypothetical protein
MQRLGHLPLPEKQGSFEQVRLLECLFSKAAFDSSSMLSAAGNFGSQGEIDRPTLIIFQQSL